MFNSQKVIKIVERENAPLLIDLICSGLTNAMTKDVLGHKLGCDGYTYIDSTVYMTEESLNSFSEKISLLLEGNDIVKTLNSFLQIWYKLSSNLLELTSEFRSVSAEESNESCIEKIEEAGRIFNKLSTALMLVVPIESYLEKILGDILHLKGLPDNQELLLELTTPIKENENELETKSINKMIGIVGEESLSLDGSDKKLSKLISAHIEEFGWLNADRFFRSNWSEKEILERIREKVLVTHENKKEINKVQFSKKEQEVISLAQEFAFFRTYRMNAFVKSSYLMRPLLILIAEKINSSFEDVIYMTLDELVGSLRAGMPQGNHEDRKNQYGYVVEGNNVRFLSGEIYNKFKRDFLIDFETEDTNSLKGVVAFRGAAKGIVKILKSTKDIPKVNKGDIIVAPMTIPSFVPAMERASAFITDEGGILCHAAIVAREMQKPCVIATGNATDLLRDGDEIEILESGVIRVIG